MRGKGGGAAVIQILLRRRYISLKSWSCGPNTVNGMAPPIHQRRAVFRLKYLVALRANLVFGGRGREAPFSCSLGFPVKRRWTRSPSVWMAPRLAILQRSYAISNRQPAIAVWRSPRASAVLTDGGGQRARLAVGQSPSVQYVGSRGDGPFIRSCAAGWVVASTSWYVVTAREQLLVARHVGQMSTAQSSPPTALLLLLLQHEF
ncbi:hypothetical protein LY76DRAFT_391336 [Colletotrichum caudatum]|nr:hypothetical protein LY76DRAFT_391336 [Colletotrichum caudatum]